MKQWLVAQTRLESKLPLVLALSVREIDEIDKVKTLITAEGDKIGNSRQPAVGCRTPKPPEIFSSGGNLV